MLTSTIIVQNICVNQYSKNVLNNVSFILNTNEHLAIIGESGSGKTILAKAIAGQLFSKGNIQINYSENDSLQNKILFVEHTEVYKNLSNVSNFYYQQRFNSCDADDANTLQQELQKLSTNNFQVNTLLEKLNLLHRIRTPLIQLSNGEQKKLQIIKALIQQPKILILDKVFTGLDTNSRNELEQLLYNLSTKGTTIILITDENNIPFFLTHIAVLTNGNLTQFTQKENFKLSTTKNISYNQNKIPKNQQQQTFHSIVSMKNVSVSYINKIILQNINWQVKQGERWLIKGANGAGKSTLLSLITGDNPQAYANEIYLFDKKRGSGESIWELKNKIGYVSPELHKYFDKSINIEHAVASGFYDTMGLYKPISIQQKENIKQWLDFFGLSHVRNKSLSAVSTGEQRLALIARAFVKNPPLLVLDEPCQNLDNNHIQQIIQLINNLCSQTNATIIYVSHYTNEIPECITNVLELNNGIATIYTKEKIKVA
ncbi:MAG: ATP-binding cassette domain-containing protein [Bacteroidetes bacterium]|nr:ATP-binding cassette domain-containing protein [Bacteroidota bacterium]MBS1650324.1 ATP-binding cassette domain-containing protein [Bacteroidota bacterium]